MSKEEKLLRAFARRLVKHVALGPFQVEAAIQDTLKTVGK